MNVSNILYVKDKVLSQLLVSYKGVNCFLNTLIPKIRVNVKKTVDKFTEDYFPFVEQGAADLLEILQPVHLSSENDFEMHKNGCVEIYLTLAVMFIALSSGELLGNTFFGTILSNIFTPSIEVFIMVAFPLSLFLRSYEDICYDEVERKKELFVSSLVMGIFIGHLFGEGVTYYYPSIYFIFLLILTLLLDNDKRQYKENMSTSGSNMMQVLFSGALTFLLMAGFSILTIKGSLILFLLIAVTYLHIEFLSRHVTTKLVSIGTNQFLYVGTFAFIQIILAII
uniref:Na_H_Exchanger domain-containing protein n=1 Tax=Parastrongyloides trichosuri TaxID=131310 RepID=A0A0N4ZRP6_PARTI